MAHGRFRSYPSSSLLVVLAACGVACGRVSAAGDPPQLAHAYGNGVHAYFAGDFQRAYEDLSEAVEGGTQDPRVWYFRGLAALKLGRTDEAEADFSTAARRESEGTGAWPVAKSLERVQGCDRLKLERHRARAGIASLQQDRQRSNLRYLEVERNRPDVTRSRRPLIDRRIDEANPFDTRAKDVPAPENADAPKPGWKPQYEEMPEPSANSSSSKKDRFAPSTTSRQDGQDELRASNLENSAEQVDGRMEREATESENAFEQRDAQQEFEAAR